jgi:DNA-directed RNA polymerase subunit M/transcription elongation factor TFIIS
MNDIKQSKVFRSKCLVLLKDLVKNKIPNKYGISFQHEDILASKLERSINNKMVEELDTHIPPRGEEKKHITWKDKKVSIRYKQYYMKVYSNMYINANSMYVLGCLKNGSIKPVDIVRIHHFNLLHPSEHELMLTRIEDCINRLGVFPYKPKSTGGLFKCNRCKSTQTSSTQFQTRSSDEPMTVFVHCNNCDKRWRC